MKGKELDFFGDGPGASTIVGATSMLHLGMKKLVIDPAKNVLVDAFGRLDSSVVTGAGGKYGWTCISTGFVINTV